MFKFTITDKGAETTGERAARGYDAAFEKLLLAYPNLSDEAEIHIYTQRNYQGFTWKVGTWRSDGTEKNAWLIHA